MQHGGRYLLTVFALSGGCGVGCGAASAAAPQAVPSVAGSQPERPNVIYILTDDQGYGDLGLHGNNVIRTPNLDAFAREGIRLDRFMVSSVSAPTRASLLTGRYHLATGVNWVTRRKEVMRQGEITLAELLKSAGYATGCFGKWHNGAQYPHNPNGQGFDEFFGFCGGHFDVYFDPLLEHNGQPVQTEGYITDVITDHAVGFIERNRDHPFLCFVPYNAPHGPFQVPDRYFDYYKSQGLSDMDAAIYGMCENVDENVGRMLDVVRRCGIGGRTIIIFSSDNGPFGERYNGGMRGVKATVHEGGTRVPCLVSLPGAEGGKIISDLTAHIDIFPTVAELCGVAIPDTLDIHGVSLVPLLAGRVSELPERSLYFHNQPWDFAEIPAGAVRTPRFRLVYEQSNDTTLFDMAKDPSQMRDLSRERPAVAARLGNDYHRWFMSVTDGGGEPRRERIEIGHEGFPRVDMPAHEAWLGWGTHYAGKQGWAGDWAVNFRSGRGESIWEIAVVDDAVYDIYIRYAVGEAGFDVNVTIAGATQTAVVRDAFPLDRPEKPARFNGPVRARRWAEMKVASMPLKRGDAKLKITVSGIADANDFALKGVVVEKRKEE